MAKAKIRRPAPPPRPDQAAQLPQAVTLHQQGRLPEAAALYREVLRAQPRQFDALHLLGVVTLQQGDLSGGARLIGEALQVAPQQAAAWSNLGYAQQLLGQHAESLASYERALALAPDTIEAHFNRGNLLRKLGRNDEALTSYDTALRLQPDYAEAWLNKGAALQEAGRHGDALDCFERLLQQKPAAAAAWYNRGNALRHLAQPEAALASYAEALRHQPEFVDALLNQGDLLAEQGRRDAALASYERALQLQPDHALLQLKRANTLRDLGRHEAALAGYDSVLAASPEHAPTWNSRGNLLLRINRPEQALASYERALALAPDYAEAHNNRGNALYQLNRAADALQSYAAAVALQPDLAAAIMNQGNVLQSQKQFAPALACYERALQLQPDYAQAHSNRGQALGSLKRYDEAAAAYAQALRLEPDHPYALGNLLHNRQLCCDWSQQAATTQQVLAAVAQGKPACAPFAFLSVSASAAAQLRCAQIQVADQFPPAPQPLVQAPLPAHARIRVAYLSADFREHPISYLMAGVFEAHDRSRFETLALSFRPWEDSAMGRRLAPAFERIIDVSLMSDGAVAALLKELEVDIAVDLMGYTDGRRPTIFARRGAPVQLSYLGYPGSMGAPYFDYLLADEFLIPPGLRQHYQEQVVYLPDCFQANDAQRPVAARRPDRAAAGLPEQGLVFCSFNNSCKITPEFFACWMRLLAAVPDSVLWLVADVAEVEDHLRSAAAGHGIAPQRLVFAPRIGYAEHLARIGLADLFLDTLPFNAGATASDALWAGVPVLTCVGEAYAARVAGSLLRALQLPELIAADLAAYEERALQLARAPAQLAALRARLAQQRRTGPVFDTQRFCRHLEAAYRTMWQRAQQGLPPQDFAVPRGA